MGRKTVGAMVVLGVYAAVIAVLASRYYSRKLTRDVSDLIKGLQLYVSANMDGHAQPDYSRVSGLEQPEDC